MNTKNDFFDVYYQAGEEPVFCYRTGLAVYEESLTGGALVSRGWNAAGYPLNVLTNCATRLDPKRFGEPFAFNLEVNGICVDYDLKFVDFTCEKDERSLHAVLVLDSGLAPVRIRIHTVLDGTAMFTRYLEIENRSDSLLNISRLSPIAGGMEVMTQVGNTEIEKYYSVGYFDEDRWGREGDFAWHDLQPAVLSVDTRFNRERYRHPLIFIRNNLMGTIWFAQIAYSGGCRFTVDYNAGAESEHSTLAFKAEITGYNPLMILNPKECCCSPEVHIGVVSGDPDAAVHQMHTHARKSVLNLPEADPSACLVGAGMGAEHDMSVATSKTYIDQFAEMGAEVFIIDAGWQCPPAREMEWRDFNGINVPDAQRYPRGLAELSDYCHQKGMRFGLWVEIERLGRFAPVYKAHPEWMLPDLYGEKQDRGFLDLSNPEAAAWAEGELARIIEEYGPDLLRVDHNFSQRHYHAMKPHASGIREYTLLRHFEAVTGMYLRLKKRFPHVIFENCAGGGGRTDWAQMKAFNHTWVSDWQKAPRSLLITGGMTMALPPERVDRLFAGMGCHACGSLDAQMRNVLFGHVSLNVVACPETFANPVQMEFIKRNVRLYKEFIRPFLPASRVFHPTPDAKEAMEKGYTMLELAADDGSRGIFGVFTLCGGEREITFTLKGVDPSKNYRVRLDNLGATFEKSGAELAMSGLTVRVPASLSSELVIYTEI